MAVLFVAWVVIFAWLSHTRRPPPEKQLPELPIFEGAYDVTRNFAEVADWEQVTYKVELSYPSTVVYQFYRHYLEGEGWKPRPPDKLPEWSINGRGARTQAGFYAQWEAPDQLRLVELTLITKPDVEPPVMQVVVRRSRAILPETPADQGR
jgi:hypothetical protein